MGRGLIVVACLLVMLVGASSGGVPAQRRVGTAAAAPTAPTVAAALRIMPLGASSTVGAGSPATAGYRGPLQELLARDGIEYDMVGSQRGGPPSVPDLDHEGYGGLTLKGMRPQAAAWVRKADPDVVLLHNGTNDLLRGDSPEVAAQHLDDLLSEIVENTDATVIVAGVWAPMKSDARDREEFSELCASTVSRFWSRGERVRFVDTSDLLTSDQFADGLHPNAAGYRAIARMWEREILTVTKRRAGS